MKDITGLDILVIFLFFISFAILLGMKIVSMIDSKINNISINIPPIKVPEPKIVFKDSFRCNGSNNDEKNSIPIIKGDKQTEDNNDKIVAIAKDVKNINEVKEVDNKDGEIKEEFSQNILKSENHKVCHQPKTEKIERIDSIETECLTGKKYKTIYYTPSDDANSPKGYNIGEFSKFLEPENTGAKLLPKDNRTLYPKYSDISKIVYPNGYVHF